MAEAFANFPIIHREVEAMIKGARINSSIGPEVFKECLVEAMQWYGVHRQGFDQKDILRMTSRSGGIIARRMQ